MHIQGIVIKGDGFGRQLGFPTANINRDTYMAAGHTLPFGIYAGFVTRANGECYRAGIVIGPNDTVGLPKLEAHLIDFEGDLYGEQLSFEIVAFVRPFAEYTTTEALQKAIAADITYIKKMELCSQE